MKIKIITEGGNMKPGPAVSQQLGPAGVNLGKVIQEVNSETFGFKGMKVPVEIDVDTKTKEFTIKVSSPPVSELLKKEIKVEKASGKPGTYFVGNLAIEHIIKTAKMKLPNMLAKDLKAAIKLVLGSCVSLGILVENKNPVEIISEVNSGKYEKEISSEKTEPSEEKLKELNSFFDKIKSRQEEEAKALEAEKAKEEKPEAEQSEEKQTETKKEEPVKKK